MLPQPAVHQAPEAKRVGFLQFIRQRSFRKILVAQGPDKSFDCASPDRGRSPVSRRRVRAAVIHGVTNFNPGGEAIANQTTNAGLQKLQKVTVGRKVLWRAMDCCRQLPFQSFRGVEQLFS